MENKEVSKVKILVTHAPPYNTCADLTENGDHVGSQGILKSIHEFEPTINICGHIHEAKALCKIGTVTDVANSGMLKDNGAVLIDIEDGSNYEGAVLGPFFANSGVEAGVGIPAVVPKVDLSFLGRTSLVVARSSDLLRFRS